MTSIALHQLNANEYLYYLVGYITVHMQRLSGSFEFASKLPIPVQEFDRRRKAWLVHMRKFTSDTEDQNRLEKLHSRIVEAHHMRDALVHGQPSIYDVAAWRGDTEVICTLHSSRKRYHKAHLRRISDRFKPSKSMMKIIGEHIEAAPIIEISYSLKEIEDMADQTIQLGFDVRRIISDMCFPKPGGRKMPPPHHMS